MNLVKTYQYDGQAIAFDFSGSNLMVIATEMAKLFDTQVEKFNRTQETKNFIAECLKSPNMGFLGIKKEEDLIISRQRSGTWMHRILALKFAAWLSPAFELWVYKTVDEILFGKFKTTEQSLKESAKRKILIQELQRKLEETEEYKQLEALEKEERKAAVDRGKQTRALINLFTQDFVNQDDFKDYTSDN